MKSTIARQVLFYISFLLLLVLIPGSSFAQDDDNPPGPDVILYVTEGNLTIYVAYPEPISLGGFEFSVIEAADDDIFFSRLEARVDLRLFSDGVPSGTCFIYQYDENAPIPENCVENRTFLFEIGAGDRFWYEPTGERRILSITRDRTTTFQFCPAQRTECPIYYSVPDPSGSLPGSDEADDINDVGLDIPTLETDLRDRFPTRILESNRGVIEELAWSPDGLYLVSGHSNGDLCVWSLSNTVEFVPLTCINGAHPQGITALDWNNDLESPRFATTGVDGAVRVWEISNSTESIIRNVLELVEDGHQGSAVDVDWNPTSEQIISTGTSQLIVWDAQTGERLTTIASNQPGVATWRSDSRYLLTIDNTGVIRVVDSLGEEGGVVIETYPASVAGVDAIWNPNFGNLATLDSNGNVRIYDYTPGNVCASTPCQSLLIAQNVENASQIRFSPSGNQIAISAQNSVHVMEAQPPYQLIGRYTLADETVDVTFTSFDWNSDGTQITASDDRGRVYIWNVTQDVPQRLNMIYSWEATSAFTPDSNDVEINTTSGLAPILAFDWSQNGRQIALVDANRNLSVWDIDNRQRIGSSQSHPRLPLAIDWNQAIGSIGTGGCGPMAIIWEEGASPQRTLEVELDDLFCVTDLAFNPVGDLLAIANQGGVIRFWDWIDEVQLSVRQLEFEIGDLEWDLLGNRLASVNDNGLLIVFDVNNNRVSQVFTRTPHPGVALNAVVWSPDARRVATASATGDIVIWDLESTDNGTTQGGLVLSGHTSPVVAVSWTVIDNRNLLVSADEGGRIIVWDACTGQRVAQTRMDATPIDIKWSPFSADGVFAVADTNGTVTIWQFNY